MLQERAESKKRDLHRCIFDCFSSRFVSSFETYNCNFPFSPEASLQYYMFSGKSAIEIAQEQSRKLFDSYVPYACILIPLNVCQTVFHLDAQLLNKLSIKSRNKRVNISRPGRVLFIKSREWRDFISSWRHKRSQDRIIIFFPFLVIKKKGDIFQKDINIRCVNYATKILFQFVSARDKYFPILETIRETESSNPVTFSTVRRRVIISS